MTTVEPLDFTQFSNCRARLPQITTDYHRSPQITTDYHRLPQITTEIVPNPKIPIFNGLEWFFKLCHAHFRSWWRHLLKAMEGKDAHSQDLDKTLQPRFRKRPPRGLEMVF